MQQDCRLTVCMIVRDEEANLRGCLESLRPHVDEIVIVDTGSIDSTPDIAREFADKFIIDTTLNDEEGRLKSFAEARNRSYALASNDWVMWVDGDDVVQGAQNIKPILVDTQSKIGTSAAVVLMAYDYAQDANGNSVCTHYRERIVRFPQLFHWVGPVHEVLMHRPECPTFSQLVIDKDKALIVHKKFQSQKTTDPLRNLRILQRSVEREGDTDPRSLYYLGLEYCNTGHPDKAIEYLTRYVDVSGWDDERCLAYLKVAEIENARGRYKEAIDAATKAMHVRPQWGEVHFSLAKSYYFLAQCDSTNASKNWEKCASFSRIGLSLPETKTVLFVNPTDRLIEIHRYLNVALFNLGDIAGALESVDAALKYAPDDGQMSFNRKMYVERLARAEAEASIKRMVDVGVLSTESAYAANAIIGGKNHPNVVVFKDFHRPIGYPRNVTANDFPVAALSPHPQAWSIPQTFVYDDLPLYMTDNQLQSVVVMVWKEYMLHDEILSAIKFLENAPYRVRHTDSTQTLLSRTRKMIDWTHDVDTYDHGNSTRTGVGINDQIRTTEMLPLPHMLGGQVGNRFWWMTDRMSTSKGATVLDLGCIDGEMSNRWGLLSFKVTGVDVCQNSVNIANAAASRHNTGARHYRSLFKDMAQVLPPEKFRFVTCGDTYEHIEHPIEDLLRPALDLADDDGELLLVTPHGAWFRGYFTNVHPWLWAEEGSHWLDENKQRAHIIAPTVWSTADDVRRAGWWVKDCFVVPQRPQDVPGQGNVCVWARKRHPELIDGKMLDIVFYVGDGLEPWTPNSVDITGIGGSEIAAIALSKRLAAMGHRVRMYVGCTVDGEGIYDGVEYVMSQKFHDIECDVLVVSRRSDALRKELNVTALVKYLWTHDTVPLGLTHELYLRADRILALSSWHKDNILTTHKYVHGDKVSVTRNGIDVKKFVDRNIVRNPHKVVVSSSPDRYMSSLLSMWPKIRERVPDAELHIFYGFDNWRKIAEMSNDANQIELIDQLTQKSKSMEDQGVFLRGRVNQNTLIDEYLSAGVWLYPTWFSETSCISAMEAQAAGLSIVTSPIAALKETVAENGAMIDGDWLSDDYQKLFIEAAVDALLNTTETRRRLQSNQALRRFGWDSVAREWHAAFMKDIEDELYPVFKSPLVDSRMS